MAKVPTLMKLLALIIRSPVKEKPLLCLLASMILKHYLPRVSLVQRVISVMLHGCAVPKKATIIIMFRLSHLSQLPFLSTGFYSFSAINVHIRIQSVSLIDNLTDDFDNEVLLWSDTLKDSLEVISLLIIISKLACVKIKNAFDYILCFSTGEEVFDN